jgi:hypothetical protein
LHPYFKDGSSIRQGLHAFDCIAPALRLQANGDCDAAGYWQPGLSAKHRHLNEELGDVWNYHRLNE